MTNFNEMTNLENYGVIEMRLHEAKTIEGGSWWKSLLKRAGPIGIAIAVLEVDWDKVAEDFKRGYNSI